MHRIGVAGLALLLAGCVAPWSKDDGGEGAAAGLDRGLATQAEEVIPTTADPASTVPASTTGGTGGTTDAGAVGTGSGTGGTDGTGDGPAAARQLAIQADAAGDAGPGAPGYADLLSVELVDTGAALRATIVVSGPIPGALEDREAAGIGLDLFITGGAESDYQIFLEGSSDGWFAYLETPQGLQQYPGTFELAADRYVVTVPWSALDDHRTGRFSVFADSSSALVAVAISSEDHAPDDSSAPFA